MTWRPSVIRAALGEEQITAWLVASANPTSPLTITTGSNDTAVLRLTPRGAGSAVDVTLTFPPGWYRDSTMACLALNTDDLPFEFTAIGGKVAVGLKGSWNGARIEYQGGTTPLGLTVGQYADAAVPPPGSAFGTLVERVGALEDGGGGGGGGAGSVALGGVGCWYASPTGTAVSGNLGYTSGNGVGAISPLFVDQTLSFSKIGYEIWTAYVSDTTYKCLLYDTADGYPNTCLAAVDIATGTAGGAKIADLPAALELAPGTYWIGAWVGAAEPATGLLVNNVGVGIMMAYSPTGSGRTGNQRIAAGWKSTSLAAPAIGSTWPSRSATGMGTDYRVPRVSLWAG